ncbi:LRR receptor-like serine/threonine-protein kinase IOS1 [Mangifera indica]|uniref:LRR receptor-like serine/threonine-protein kinase IOS1 n=1 Tax=Mangifera indica TaxID=29780 RepID=UPI001CFB00BC|nr:LRR receptor-like serine/threonine-protein kinase IOS1 [Mangifera indica]
MAMRMFHCKCFAFLVAFAFFLLQVHAQEPGFISIDCGATSNYTDPTTGLYYVSDSSFIATGVTYSVSATYQLDSLQKPLWNLRSFPEGSKNCYHIKVTKQSRYLIRANFFYGNFDDKATPPQSFDLYLGVNQWDSIVLGNVSTIVFREIIHFSPSDYIDICLVNTGSGTPLISSLEFRQLKNTTYVTQSAESLIIYARMNVQPITNAILRYPDDVFDRRWVSYNDSTMDQLTTDATIDAGRHNGFQPPQIVMKSAGIPKNVSEPLQLTFTPVDPTSKIYVYMHFAELEHLPANQSRRFSITVNGNYLYGPTSPTYLYTFTVYTSSSLSGAQLVFQIIKTEDSTLPPILNAVEIYVVKDLPQSETEQEEADAINNIKSLYKMKDWQGDPCLPQDYLWAGLDCKFNGYDPPRIISLDLSSNGLTGEIPPYISNLTMIQQLDLSNNSLTGSVPKFLSELQFLNTLKLSGNNFTGSLPVDLIERSENGSLSLSVDGNPYLCASVSCAKKKKNNVVVPVVVAFAALFILSAALAIFCRIKCPRRGHIWGRTPRKSSYVLTEKIRRFTYAELSMITGNFKRELGKGSFGSVYHGYLDDDTEVAVKILSELSNQGYEEFEAEVKLLQTVHHRNLTPLYGYCAEGKQIGLVYEYMANGNLKQHLSDKSADVMSWEGRLRAAVEAAQGLEYLHHGCKPPRVHRDIKSANILLSENFHARIADFGLTKTFPVEGGTHLSTDVAGTFGYLDPQYCQTYRLTEKSDVYSFGVVLLELITSRPVIANNNGNNHISQWVGSMIAQGDIKKTVDPRLGGDFDINSAWKAVEMAMLCVSQTSDERPSMNYVVRELSQCLEMEIARKERRGVQPGNHYEMVSLNLGTDLIPSAR